MIDSDSRDCTRQLLRARGATVTWIDASAALAELLGGKAPALAVVSPHQGFEEMWLARELNCFSKNAEDA